MPSTHSDAAATVALAAALRHHFNGVVLPVWRGPGFNAALSLPYEALGAEDHRPAPVERYRAMACARQLFVFSQAGDAAHAQTLFHSLTHIFQDTEHGGWFYSVDPHGAPLDTTKDLYTHAFVVFACAEYGRRSGNRDALDIVHRTSALIQSRFAATDDLFNAALSADFATVTAAPIQNPLMHLTEAWLAAREATRDNAFDAALRRLAGAVARHFVHAPSGCIAELPVGTPDNRFEPGHQFEWFWLAKQAGGLFEGSKLAENLSRAFDFAQRHGVDPHTGGVCASLDEAGHIKDPVQRIWAQTEYLRALASHDEPAVRAVLPRQIELFQQRFLRPQGWFECKTASGDVARADMPSTTPYHLATAFDALPA
ncbi:AGE family epimerase/isomerase [Paraburkholderia phenoliruptrix]|uniref:Mannose-6-phosphate isomerase n=2 Tax=Paraburkholderia phenoliruptrix TaxID=252970 RepID=K0DVD5_9BURK|nr:AGE family epimerase/isomerase [Paraburkholderia phenoliruptrix]AFT88860.1 mannose-6-phosphate isomerase [Paraburkholderia phenoliruptrix BR3459a]MDR6423580.1 mannose-6-phosphate isomerase [Paraburkholderia phenoliruptrix]CAB4052156.1 Cellobiose 2-epimerase [Paraburkholderia phenoliruptrix]